MLDYPDKMGKVKEMLVRAYWPGWLGDTIDGFWVEATFEEAETRVFPFLTPKDIIKSRELAERYQAIATDFGEPSRPYCFLVSRDLERIEPFHVHYPYHQLWNAYSPFGLFSKHHIDSLGEIAEIEPHDVDWLGIHSDEDSPEDPD